MAWDGHQIISTKATITAITIQSDMRTNYIFVQTKWLPDMQRLLPDQPFLSRKRKRLYAPLALGNLNNSLRCADAIGSATCVCAVYLTVCSEEIRTWITDKRYHREPWGEWSREGQPWVNYLPKNDNSCQGDMRDLRDKSGFWIGWSLREYDKLGF